MIEFDRVSVQVEVLHEGRPQVRTLLHPVSLALTERRIGVIGANGSGKSTLLRLVNGLSEATDGQVRVDGRDPARDGAAVRRHVGFIFTDPLSQLVMATPVDDVELSLRRLVPDRARRRERALALLAAQGLGDRAETSVHDLSGGERQLVALTSVLATEPTIIVADEPTTLLDLRHRNRVVAALHGAAQQLVIATHDLDLAATLDRVIVVDDARVVADGEPAASIAAYRELMS